MASYLLYTCQGKIYAEISVLITSGMILEKNISALKKQNPGLAEALLNYDGTVHEVLYSRQNHPTLQVDNVTLHSIYDPVREAQDWADHYDGDITNAASIYVLGFGLGYHVMELCRRTEKEAVVIEPRMDILHTAMRTMDLSTILDRITLITNYLFHGDHDDVTILRHGPSVNLSSKYFNNMLRMMKFGGSIKKPLKIMVVSPIYGGSLPIARYCSSSLKKMGHSVELIDNSRFSDALFYARDMTKQKSRHDSSINHLTAFLSETLMARCEAFNPDLVFALAQSPVTLNCLEELKGREITTAYWFVEDYRVMDYWEAIAPHYDFFFTIQRGEFIDRLAKAGVRNAHYLPMAAFPDIHRNEHLSGEELDYYGSDISFLGAGYYNRRHFFKGLLDFDFKIWGNEWPHDSYLTKYLQRNGERIETDDAVKVFNASKININLHSSTHHRGINPFGDFVNPRTFEIASCGGFQLVDRREEIGDLFEVGKEIILFDDIDDLRNKISHYLKHPDDRRRIAEKARQKIMKEHTYEHRMQDMLLFLAERLRWT
jgi:spore maturation protein CgeB